MSPRSTHRPRPSPRLAEFTLAVVTLYVLARTPVLFLRERTDELVGGPIRASWADDVLIGGTFLAFEALVVVTAFRRCDRRQLLAQWPLAPFLVIVGTSVLWSVEPAVTARRAAMFTATAMVGWYVGQRFSVRQQAVVVAWVGSVAAFTSLAALLIWPDQARTTDGYEGLWSGVFVHRNLLGLAMSTGLLALIFVLPRLRGGPLAAAIAVGGLEAYLLWQSGSRTGVVALVAAGCAIGAVGGFRHLGSKGVSAARGAGLVMATGTIFGLAVYQWWDQILTVLGRGATLSSRATVWEIVGDFAAERPLWGWGFEAFWAHPPAMAEATTSLTFAHAHSGYLEVLLGVGRVGFALFCLFLAVTLWRVFRLAWSRHGLDSLWPLALAVFVLVTDLSESFLVANHVQWSLLVMAGTTAAYRVRSASSPSSLGTRAAQTRSGHVRSVSSHRGRPAQVRLGEAPRGGAT